MMEFQGHHIDRILNMNNRTERDIKSMTVT